MERERRIAGWRCIIRDIFLRELSMESRMNHSEPSVFDLSPAEKLELVEDLWDDLAGTPEAVPVHYWQQQELARRKANLLKNPAAGLSWGEVKQRARGALSFGSRDVNTASATEPRP
jgi:putative addiction module component (TIGR02574 family)